MVLSKWKIDFSAGAEASASDDKEKSDDKKKPKKNRCHVSTCRKKVGLTGKYLTNCLNFNFQVTLIMLISLWQFDLRLIIILSFVVNDNAHITLDLRLIICCYVHCMIIIINLNITHCIVFIFFRIWMPLWRTVL